MYLVIYFVVYDVKLVLVSIILKAKFILIFKLLKTLEASMK